MKKDKIEDGEILYRAVNRYPQYWKEDKKSVSSALFKDKNGVSVVRDGNRAPNDIFEVLRNKMPKTVAVVDICAKNAREVKVHLVPKP